MSELKNMKAEINADGLIGSESGLTSLTYAATTFSPIRERNCNEGDKIDASSLSFPARGPGPSRGRRTGRESLGVILEPIRQNNDQNKTQTKNRNVQRQETETIFKIEDDQLDSFRDR
jgi:hypothetical protein